MYNSPVARYTFVYHQPFGLYIITPRRVSFLRLDDIQCSALMICRNKLRMIYTALPWWNKKFDFRKACSTKKNPRSSERGFFIQADKGGLVWHHALACMESTPLALYGILRSRPLRRLDSIQPFGLIPYDTPCRFHAAASRGFHPRLRRDFARLLPCFFFLCEKLTKNVRP